MSKGLDERFIFLTKIVSEIVSKQNKITIDLIEKFCRENGYIPNIIEKEKLELILKLGIAEYERRLIESREKDERYI